jgi:predicted enzyme related to lactoylglutathione lyase
VGAERDVAARLLAQLARAAQAGYGYQEGQRIIATCEDEPWYLALAAGGFHLDASTWSQLRAWGDYDPGPDLDRLTTPALAIFGSNDPLVPVQTSIARLRKPLCGPPGPSRSPSSPALTTGCRPGAAPPPDTSPASAPGAANRDYRPDQGDRLRSQCVPVAGAAACQDGRMEVLSSRVLLRPDDLGRSRHFYRDVLGLAIYREFGSPADPGVVFFLGPGFLEVSGHSAGAAGHSVMLWLQVRDINAEHQRLAAAGARILREPVTEPWGLTEMWIEDPDGVRIVLVEVPADHPLRRDPRSTPPRSSTDDISPT